MAISDKLNYLIETKQLFKDRLNSLGAEIIESTTFRNYLTWLNNFYTGSANKTDLAKNGVVGRTSQESTTGKNLLPTNASYWETGHYDSSSGEKSRFDTRMRLKNLVPISSSTTYYVSNALNKRLIIREYNANKEFIYNTGSIDSGNTFTTESNTYYLGISIEITYSEYDETASQLFMCNNNVVDKTYEPYTGGQPSPSPDYPQEINNLSGDVEYKVRGKNLFDKDNANILNAYFNSNIPTITSNDSNRVIYIKCEANTTYTLSRLKGSVFSVGYTTTIPTNGTSVSGAIDGTMGTYDGTTRVNCTITTGNNAQYLVCRIAQVVNDGANSNNIINSLQIEENPTPTEYEPYISESFPLSLKSKNLFDKDNANVISAYISGARVIYSGSPAVDKLIYIPCKPNTTYSLQKMLQETTNYNRFRIGTTTDTPALRMTVEDYFNAGDGSTLTNKTITTGANANYLVFYCYREDTLTSFEDMMSSIQIEEGSTATTYEPYYDINLCNISDYKDRIYSQNGEFYLEKKTGKVVFDGSESWTINTSYTYNVFYRTLDNYARISNTQTTYCEYYKGIENAGGIANFGNNYNNSIGVRTANDNIKDIYISNNSITSASDFKTWLSTHNTVVYYVLATPTTTEITEENYPTLYSQLLAIQEFLTKYKINKEFLLDYSSPEIEY